VSVARRIAVTRTRHRLLPDARRVLAKPYYPGDEITPSGDVRANMLLDRVLAIPEAQVPALLADVLREFADRHAELEALFLRHFGLVSHRFPSEHALSHARRLLIGAYFTHEYSIEGAALFNPSIVWAPFASDDTPGRRHFVMSMRAVGEGHISSIEFRSGAIDDAGEVAFDEPGRTILAGRRAAPDWYNKTLFAAKLAELGAANEISASVLDRLPDRFTPTDLDGGLAWLEQHGPTLAIRHETAKVMRVLAASNYVTSFPPESTLSERVLFPAGPHETSGMEDARFVRFCADDGTSRYYATYTAFDGLEILPQLIETPDFITFSISTLHGAAAQNKGMALFPRAIDGRYVMLSRKDRENLWLARSHDVHSWDDAVELRRPVHPWELLQIGNCGSPIETEAGWLVLTHGVGAMRRYCIGALLLDLADPERVVGSLAQPLLEPDKSEREGYVPNVLYTCGAIAHGTRLIVPYGFSDGGITIASISLSELLDALTHQGP
jgi:predicted GH43/DUF377 family glycosyl hydrolase